MMCALVGNAEIGFRFVFEQRNFFVGFVALEESAEILLLVRSVSGHFVSVNSTSLGTVTALGPS